MPTSSSTSIRIHNFNTFQCASAVERFSSCLLDTDLPSCLCLLSFFLSFLHSVQILFFSFISYCIVLHIVPRLRLSFSLTHTRAHSNLPAVFRFLCQPFKRTHGLLITHNPLSRSSPFQPCFSLSISSHCCSRSRTCTFPKDCVPRKPFSFIFRGTEHNKAR